MNGKLKKELKSCFEAPAPKMKTAFLESIPQPQVTTRSFIVAQIPFIKKALWPLSILIFFPALWGAYFSDPNMIWIVSSFAPFLAMAVVTESAKSIIYGMDELEQAARFSLKSVVLARLIVLGTFNLSIMCFLIPICCVASTLSFIRIGVYLFTPYLLTAAVCLWIVRHFRNREVIYACMAVTVLVSGVNAIIRLFASALLETHYFMWWVILVAVLSGTVGLELYQWIKRSEEQIWSLSLTD